MKKLLFLSLLLLAPSLLAQNVSIELDPFLVRENDDLEVKVSGVWGGFGGPQSPRVSRDGKTITIDLVAVPQGPISVSVPWGERVRVGRLDDGIYTLIVKINGFEAGRSTFEVTPRVLEIAPAFGGAFTRVRIRGVNLDDCTRLACVTVLFGDRPAENVTITPELDVIAVAPEAPAEGTVGITVSVDGGATYTQLGAFHYGQLEPVLFMERVLLPENLYASGAHGSEWRTDTIVRNDGPVEVATEPLFWADPASPVLPIPMPIPPGGRGYFPWRESDGGAFLWVPRDLEQQLSYSLHVVDRSRNELDRGTELPVVRSEDTGPFVRILNVPSDARYRAKLRIYNFDLENGERVEIRLLRDGEAPVTLYATLTGVPSCPTTPCIPDRPAFAAVDLPQLPPGPSIDVTIRAVTNDVRLWGFVTVTNNETQHVTAYTPQHVGGAAGS